MDEIFIFKGHTERLVVKHWESTSGITLVSIGVQFLHSETGRYKFKKGGMALRRDEALELAEALIKAAEALPEEDDDVEEE